MWGLVLTISPASVEVYEMSHKFTLMSHELHVCSNMGVGPYYLTGFPWGIRNESWTRLWRVTNSICLAMWGSIPYYLSSVLQWAAACCSVLQCVSVCYSVLQCVAVCCSVLQCVAVCCSVLQYVSVCYSVMQCVAVCCSVLQDVAVCCSMLQCVVECCSLL